MIEKKTQAIDLPAPVAPVEETWLDLATKEVVTVTPSGERRYSPQEAVFDFYVSMKTFPARNGAK